MTSSILVVEDEEHLAEGIRVNFEAEGWSVDVAGDGEQALALWRSGSYDLIVLDVMLPKLDGHSVCRAIREKGDRVPVLFLTAKNTSEDRIQGLELGADDYLGKPFHLKELLLRVRGILKRQAWYDAPSERGDELNIGGSTVNLSTYELTDPEGRVTVLRQKEVILLKLLREREGEVITREEILDYVWGYDVFPSTRTVDNLVVQLRKLLEPHPHDPIYLHTVRGVGYRFTSTGRGESQG
jgi:two-component system alkaline phosphatase synthesis response regulator PhoP